MKVVVCWSGMQGYFAACLQAWKRLGGVDLFVIHLDYLDLPFQEELLQGIPNQCFRASDPNTGIPQLVADARPEVVFLCGWFYPPYRQLLLRDDLKHVRFVLGMDTPWTGGWRQRINLMRLGALIRRMDKVVVAGPRTREFARRLGTPPERSCRVSMGSTSPHSARQALGGSTTPPAGPSDSCSRAGTFPKRGSVFWSTPTAGTGRW